MHISIAWRRAEIRRRERSREKASFAALERGGELDLGYYHHPPLYRHRRVEFRLIILLSTSISLVSAMWYVVHSVRSDAATGVGPHRGPHTVHMIYDMDMNWVRIIRAHMTLKGWKSGSPRLSPAQH